MKKLLTGALSMVMLAGLMTGCGSNASTNGEVAANEFDLTQEITIVSREDGSGTRGAFVELFGIEQKDEEGNKVDYTTDEAIISNSTSVMMTTVQSDEAAIGYISLGSLNDTVKAVQIDGAEATVENIKNGSYKISRPFNVVTKGELTNEVAKDFMNFILSTEGQAIVNEAGYISIDGTQSFAGTSPVGKVVVAGSSSVTPVMEKLKEAYVALNPNAEIEIQESDSTTGMTSAMDGICDIGMASRELKDSEIEGGLTATTIALDGIAVIVNETNSMDSLTSESVKGIYTGEMTTWEEAQ